MRKRRPPLLLPDLKSPGVKILIALKFDEYQKLSAIWSIYNNLYFKVDKIAQSSAGSIVVC